ncbi:MAG: ferrochelatase [Thermoactinomyces sp.]
MAGKTGLLVMAYGTPGSPEEIEPYYTHIRRGKKPPAELLANLRRKYEMIGGISPLASITEKQTAALEKELNSRANGYSFKAYLGLKHIHPFIEDTVKKMYEEGIGEAVSIVLAPHYSIFSVKSYNDRAVQEADKLGGPLIHTVDSWYKEPKFVDYWTNQLKQTFSSIPSEERERTIVIFSAHSLPEKILDMGDPYPDQLQETADLIAEQAQIKHYTISWQSAGKTSVPWLGPDVKDLTRQLYEQKGYRSFVYCPVGFVADHLEILYDIDIQCRRVTEELGAKFYRPEMPNTNPLFIKSLADVVEKRLAISRK